MHDLTLHCEAMAENESLASAETQRKLLTALQSDLTHLKFAAQKKHTTFQAANRELEGKKRERGKTSSCIQEQEMKKLLSEAKELILVSGIQAVTITPEQLEIHKVSVLEKFSLILFRFASVSFTERCVFPSQVK